MFGLHFRSARIDSYLPDDEVKEKRLRTAWHEEAPVVVGKPSVIDVYPYDDLAFNEDFYMPETFFTSQTPTASVEPTDRYRHATFMRATVPDSMEYYQSVKLGELQSKAPGWWRPINQVEPVYDAPYHPARSVNPQYGNSRHIMVRGHTRDLHDDNLSRFVRTLPDESGLLSPDVLHPWPAGTI